MALGLDARGYQAAAEATAAGGTRRPHEQRHDAHDASAISIADAAGTSPPRPWKEAGAVDELQADHEADATARSDHLADASDAHDTSSISILDTANDFTATDVEGLLGNCRAITKRMRPP